MILIATYLCSFAFAFSLQSVPPVLNLLIRDFQLTHAQAGLTMALFALPMVFFSVPAGIIADRYGPKLVGLMAFAVTIAGHLIVAFSPVFPMILAGRAVTGIGAFTLAIVGPQLLSQWFLGKELGLAMGIWNTAFPLATTVSLATMGVVGQAMGWQSPMFIAAAISLLSMAVFGLLARPAPHLEDRTQSQGPMASAMLQVGVPIWSVGAAWLFFNASLQSFMTFGPDYFQSTGYPVATAGLMSSMILWGSLFMGPLVGLLVDRGWQREGLIVLGSLGTALGLFLVPVSQSMILVPILWMALVGSLLVTSIFALPPTLLPPSLMGLAYGILNTFLNIGTSLGPPAVGLIRDLSGTYTGSFWIMALFALLSGVSIAPLFFLPTTGRNS
jgi:MFS family permease